MKKTVAILALLAAAGAAQASISSFVVSGSATFTNKNSVDAQGDPDNNVDSAVLVGPGGAFNAVRVTGSLTEVNTGTFASEARVRMTAGAGNAFTAFNLGAATATGNYTGTLAIGPTALAATAGVVNAGGTVNFEWFESFQDDANLPEQRWDTVTYEFGQNAIINGNFNLGSLNGNGSTLVTAGSHVSGGLDFFAFSLADGVDSLGESLSLRMNAGTSGTSMTDTEFALYDGAGNFVASNDDFGVGFFSGLDFADAGLAPGNYTLVTGGFNTLFAATVNGAHTAGTNAGTYSLEMTYTVPAPGALALVGLGGLVAARRRRA